MFNIGDRIVYPLYGAGIIESIEEKEVLGQKKKYYILRIPIDDMKVMIPIDAMTEFKIRNVICYNEFEDVIRVFKNSKSDVLDNWGKRYRSNIDKIKSGNVYSISGVVKDLMMRELKKGLSSGEKKILENAKQILYSELMVVGGLTQVEIDNIITEAISKETC